MGRYGDPGGWCHNRALNIHPPPDGSSAARSLTPYDDLRPAGMPDTGKELVTDCPTGRSVQQEREEILTELNRLRGAIHTLNSGAGSDASEVASSQA